MRLTARFGIVACLLLAASLAPAATRSDFDAVVDFSVSLATVAAAANGEGALPAGKLFVLDGTVSELVVLDREEGSFRARIELLTGEWVGTEDVKSYACLIEFLGPGILPVVPVPASAGPLPRHGVSQFPSPRRGPGRGRDLHPPGREADGHGRAVHPRDPLADAAPSPCHNDALVELDVAGPDALPRG